MATLEFDGNDILITAAELDEDMMLDLQACGAQGDALPYVRSFLATHDVEVDPDMARLYLMGYGAWDDAELAEHGDNVERLVWLAGCMLNEDDEIYFSAY